MMMQMSTHHAGGVFVQPLQIAFRAELLVLPPPLLPFPLVSPPSFEDALPPPKGCTTQTPHSVGLASASRKVMQIDLVVSRYGSGSLVSRKVYARLIAGWGHNKDRDDAVFGPF
jgi:hypothetical protein